MLKAAWKIKGKVILSGSIVIFRLHIFVEMEGHTCVRILLTAEHLVLLFLGQEEQCQAENEYQQSYSRKKPKELLLRFNTTSCQNHRLY